MTVVTHKDPDAIGLTSFSTSTRFGRIHYVGPATRAHKEAVVFLHGFGSNWSIWIPLIEASRRLGLLSNLDLLLIDLPSFGSSENRIGHLISREVGEELLALTDSLGYTKIHLAGHSMGGFLALDLAASSKRVLSVHLVAGSYLTLLQVVQHPGRGLVRNPRIASFYFFQLLISRSDILTAAVNGLSSVGVASRPRLYKLGGKSFLYASRNGLNYDARRIWGQISVPVYATFGSIDKLVPPSDMRELQSIVPSAHTTLIPGAAHSMLVTHPDETAKAIFSDI
ncbi:MAG TPA: alpha/beta hydrolase [Candidatus Saccharimonadia bacterium]|nr:alpha/beta hydrolase [Candidatus Saccharimonadia bacterium]